MPVSWDIDEELGLTTVTVEGELDLALARQVMSELYALPSYRPPMVDLWDLRAARLVVNSGEVQFFVRFLANKRGDRGTQRTALVVKPGADFGLSRMYQGHAESSLPLTVRLFSTLDEAQAWLALAR